MDLLHLPLRSRAARQVRAGSRASCGLLREAASSSNQPDQDTFLTQTHPSPNAGVTEGLRISLCGVPWSKRTRQSFLVASRLQPPGSQRSIPAPHHFLPFQEREEQRMKSRISWLRASGWTPIQCSHCTIRDKLLASESAPQFVQNEEEPSSQISHSAQPPPPPPPRLCLLPLLLPC